MHCWWNGNEHEYVIPQNLAQIQDPAFYVILDKHNFVFLIQLFNLTKNKVLSILNSFKVQNPLLNLTWIGIFLNILLALKLYFIEIYLFITILMQVKHFILLLLKQTLRSILKQYRIQFEYLYIFKNYSDLNIN